MRKLRSDIVIGCGLLAFSAFAAWRTLYIKGQSAGMIAGPSFLPWLMICAIIVLSLLLVLRARHATAPVSAKAGDHSVDDGEDMRARRHNLLRIGLFALMLTIYSAAFMPLGYLPATLIVFVAGMLLMGERSPIKFFVLPVLITGAVWFGFTRLLQVWLP